MYAVTDREGTARTTHSARRAGVGVGRAYAQAQAQGEGRTRTQNERVSYVGERGLASTRGSVVSSGRNAVNMYDAVAGEASACFTLRTLG